MIEILMATYNGAAYLEEQLKSIENQTFTGWHLTVHDDGSSDGTWSILQKFQVHMGPDRVELKKNEPPTGSAKKNFMSLIQTCEADYVMCCDQDDVWHGDKVERSFHRMVQMEKRYGKDQPLLVYTDLRVVDGNLAEINPGFHKYMNLRTDSCLSRELIQNQVTGCTMLFNRQLRNYMTEAKEMGHILMHDHFAALIALVFGHMSYLNQPTIDYRQHGDNSVGAQDAGSLAYRWQRLCRGRKKFRQDMVDSTAQTAYFCHIYTSCINDDIMLKLLNMYAELYNKNKLLRVFAFFRYGFWKKGLLRKVMQVIWG